MIVKVDFVRGARMELQLLDQSVRDCSDRLMEMSPADKDADLLRKAIKKANGLLRAELDIEPDSRL